jgi:hypothetical protein
VSHFIDDLDALKEFAYPLPGTFLNDRGIPQKTDRQKRIQTHDPFFPNRILELPQFYPAHLRAVIGGLTMNEVRKMFEAVLDSPAAIEEVNFGQYRPDYAFKDSRIAVRKVLSRYWDNSSCFGVDLVSAVLRQGGFVQKMRKYNWLKSPNLSIKLAGLIVKYHRFVNLNTEHPGMPLVPTLDVDLAWVWLPILLSFPGLPVGDEDISC